MTCRRHRPRPTSILPAVFAITTLAGVAAGAEVSATRLDGTTINGELRQWDHANVVIASPNGEQRIATDQLASLRWPTDSSAVNSTDKSSGTIELIDGSVLPAKSIRAEGSNATFTLDGPTSAGDKSLTLPNAKIAAIRFRELDEALTKQWDEMRRQNSASDMFAVLKKDGKSLDYVEGVIGDVSDDKIEIKLEGETQRVDRAKIAGIVYFRPDRRSTEEPRAIIQGHRRLRLSATRVELKDSLLNITTSAGLKLTWPLGDIWLADFSAGKLSYLSDMEPATQKWTPLVGLPPAATIAAEYGKPRRDKSAYGGPLSLQVKTANREGEAPAEPSLKSFNKGLAIRSRTEVVYRLPTGFRRFIALAGIDPTASTNGNVRLIISGDDRVLLETEIAGNEPQPIQLDIANVRRLKIVVDYGQNLDTGDWLNLCDARIVK